MNSRILCTLIVAIAPLACSSSSSGDAGGTSGAVGASGSAGTGGVAGSGGAGGSAGEAGAGGGGGSSGNAGASASGGSSGNAGGGTGGAGGGTGGSGGAFTMTSTCGVTPCKAGELCCFDIGMQTPACSVASACDSASGKFTALVCEGNLDCGTGGHCCLTADGHGTQCSAQACPTVELCHSVEACAPSSTGVKASGCFPDASVMAIPTNLKQCHY